MTKPIKFFLLLIINCMLVSCTSSINITDFINKNSPFNLTVNSTDTATGFTESTQTYIAVNSEKYLKLIKWFNSNKEGWKPTPASYVSDVSITQDSFTLLYLKKGSAVVSFTDKENKPRQYSKSIKKGELDFLILK